MTPSPLVRTLQRRTFLAGTTVVAGGLTLAACSGDGDSGGGSADGQIVVVMPDQSTQNSFDAGFSVSLDFWDMQLALHSTLIRKPYKPSDEDGVVEQDLYSFEGLLAESYEVSADQLVYTFHLRQGVKSSQGNELTADDVIWSYQRKFGSDTSITPYVVAPAITDPDTQFAKVDQYTVTVTVARPGDGFTLLSTMADVTGQIYDTTYLKANASSDDPWATAWSSGRNDFGFGPYTVESTTEGSETVLKANPAYVLGEPAVKRIVRRVVADAGSRVTAMQGGDADIALALRSADQATLAGATGFTVSEIPANNHVMCPLVVTRAPFDDAQVRKAFALAIDYDQVVEQVFQGRAEKMNTFLRTDAPGYSGEGLPDYSYDPDGAKAMLAEAGHADGVAFTLTYSTAEGFTQDLAVSIQSSAKAAGFTIELEPLPSAQFSERTQNHDVQACIATGGAISLSPPYELLLNTTKDAASNISSWENDAFYAAVDNGVNAGDALSPEAGKFWNEAERIWLGDDAATVFVVNTFPTSALGPKLTGWAWRTDTAVDYSVLSFTAS
jgi:peptide/nickel transport system substrate-binding protein